MWARDIETQRERRARERDIETERERERLPPTAASTSHAPLTEAFHDNEANRLINGAVLHLCHSFPAKTPTIKTNKQHGPRAALLLHLCTHHSCLLVGRQSLLEAVTPMAICITVMYFWYFILSSSARAATSSSSSSATSRNPRATGAAQVSAHSSVCYCPPDQNTQFPRMEDR